uniref:Uncharacterized protein n=1 Tax=Arundo donax TaxID=35708 RepID=A0A0A9AR05_ARUDO
MKRQKGKLFAKCNSAPFHREKGLDKVILQVYSYSNKKTLRLNCRGTSCVYFLLLEIVTINQG